MSLVARLMNVATRHMSKAAPEEVVASQAVDYATLITLDDGEKEPDRAASDPLSMLNAAPTYESGQTTGTEEAQLGDSAQTQQMTHFGPAGAEQESTLEAGTHSFQGAGLYEDVKERAEGAPDGQPVLGSTLEALSPEELHKAVEQVGKWAEDAGMAHNQHEASATTLSPEEHAELAADIMSGMSQNTAATSGAQLQESDAAQTGSKEVGQWINNSVQETVSQQQAGATGTGTGALAAEEEEDSDDVDMEASEVVRETYLSQEVVAAQVAETTQLLSRVGVSTNARVVMIQASSAVTPIEIEEVVDAKGNISNILDLCVTTFGVHVIPAGVTAIPRKAIPSRHKIFEYGGKDYYHPQEKNEERITDFVAQCIVELGQGLLVKKSLHVDFKADGEEKETLAFSPEELQDVVAYLSNYNSKVVELEGNSLFFIAGDYMNVK
jgi:hypothetical protein